MVLLMCSMLILVSCSKTNNSNDSLPEYLNFNELPLNYTLENAKADGCVVFKDLSLISGQTEWSKFRKLVKGKKAATVRIAEYYSKENPSLVLIDLSFDGSAYLVTEEDGVKKQYNYLNHYKVDAGKDASYSTLDCYILVNQKDVSFDELERSRISSNSNDYIDQYRIFVNQIP